MKKLLCTAFVVTAVISSGYAQKPAAKATATPQETKSTKGARPQATKQIPEAAQSLFDANKNNPQKPAQKAKPTSSGK